MTKLAATYAAIAAAAVALIGTKPEARTVIHAGVHVVDVAAETVRDVAASPWALVALLGACLALTIVWRFGHGETLKDEGPAC